MKLLFRPPVITFCFDLPFWFFSTNCGFAILNELHYSIFFQAVKIAGCRFVFYTSVSMCSLQASNSCLKQGFKLAVLNFR
ncbi:hypothetical protein TU77_02545 [Pseudomonas synxantha]|nr:hypothetical protein TU77_02545 [Pseudomonas synxantha]PRW70449.1 hypothetical protein C7A09_03615 [Pseudomonas fluorescens]